MPREVEIKLRIPDVPAFRRALKQLGARPISKHAQRVHEWNEAFATPNREFKKKEQLLRIRTETIGSRARKGRTFAGAILTFKQPASHVRPHGNAEHKIREETEVSVGDGAALRQILQALGLRVWFRYEKYRTTFRLPVRERWARSLLIELDETPIGAFVELEGPARAIDRAAKALGYSKLEYITTNYFALYREHCRRTGKKVGDMVFARNGKDAGRA